MTRISTIAIAAIVLLRLLCGWHFFNEGVKKLDPSFSSAGFLRTAKGTFAPLFRSMIPGPYGAHIDLARPIEFGSRSAETQAAIDGWLADYGKRADQAAKDGKPLPHDIDPAVPGSGWVQNIAKGWDQGIQRLEQANLGDETIGKIRQLRDEKLGEVVYYVYGIYPDIEDLQHEEWRLHQLRESGGDTPAPFAQALIDQKDNENWLTMQPWIATVRQIEDQFIEAAQALAADADVEAGSIADALEEKSNLKLIDGAVTCVVLGAGVCVFLGFLTPVAGVIAAGFLLSLIMTQPPWATGADMTAFFNWSIELAAFLVLATVGAGRWAGLDGVILGVWRRSREPKPSTV
ncbi:DoxX family protein [Botrimarina mediterranea]|uniref:DoxX family protein n=1 Tax=Botrimarina mediterranea TaxID=2528022 RepID=UPI0011898B97|nr:hypothetical protein K2D_31730 [Planctomycetes bacterium K2D]